MNNKVLIEQMMKEINEATTVIASMTRSNREFDNVRIKVVCDELDRLHNLQNALYWLKKAK